MYAWMSEDTFMKMLLNAFIVKIILNFLQSIKVVPR